MSSSASLPPPVVAFLFMLTFCDRTVEDLPAAIVVVVVGGLIHNSYSRRQRGQARAETPTGEKEASVGLSVTVYALWEEQKMPPHRLQ